MGSVIADFTSWLTTERDDWDDPLEGRIILSEDQLVLAASKDEKLTISLDSVIDVSTGKLPRIFDPMPGTPITIAYRDGMDKKVAAIGADEGTADKFVTVLFKALLNGTAVTIKHPAQVGGRVMDSSFQGGILTLTTEAVQFETDEGPVTIPLDSVVDFDREKRVIDGVEKPVLVVSHMQTGEDLTTVAATDSTQKLSILGRYLRQEYQSLLDSIKSMTLSEPETETLTSLYSMGDMDISLTSVLDESPKKVKRILHALHEKGLIESGENNPVLTAKGQIVVNEYLERVNA
ncbi:MAG: CheF family chemotaxis protein [Haloarculaceae archaeon]